MTKSLSPALPDDIDRLAETILDEACRRSFVLATAESCTGGLLASLLTDVEGASHAFDRGFVTYTKAAKMELLGVPEDLLEAKGTVSPETAIAMAEGALQRSQAHISLSTTGFAGPAGPGDEAGLGISPARAKGARRFTGSSISAASGVVRPASPACGPPWR